MTDDISLDEYKEAYREMRLEESKKGFFGHLATYVLVNIILIVINLTVTGDDVLWFFFPLIVWGVGIVMNYLQPFHWAESRLEEKEAMIESRAREKEMEWNQKRTLFANREKKHDTSNNSR